MAKSFTEDEVVFYKWKTNLLGPMALHDYESCLTNENAHETIKRWEKKIIKEYWGRGERGCIRKEDT